MCPLSSLTALSLITISILRVCFIYPSLLTVTRSALFILRVSTFSKIHLVTAKVSFVLYHGLLY